jgi:hypothetical protein
MGSDVSALLCLCKRYWVGGPNISLFYIITLRIQALSLVESHDLLEDRRTELRHTKLFVPCS